MATITVIGTPQSGTASGTNQVTLTFDVVPNRDDVVFAWGGHHNGGGSSVTPVTADYVQVINDVGSNPFFGVWYKRMGVTPDTTVVMPADGTANNGCAYGAIVLRGVHQAILDQTTTTSGPTASTNPDPAAIVTVTDNAMVLALAVSTSNDSAPGTMTNYTVFSSAGINVTGTDASCSGARRIIATGGTNEDPPAWGSWTTGTWKVATLAVKAGDDLIGQSLM